MIYLTTKTKLSKDPLNEELKRKIKIEMKPALSKSMCALPSESPDLSLKKT